MTATEDQITPHVVRTEIGGLPFAYQRSVLRADPDLLRDTLADIEAIRQRPESKLKDLQLQPHPHKKPGFLELTSPVEVDALAVRDTLRTEGFTGRLEVEPAYLADDPDGRIMGMPVKHGHGTTRTGIQLVGFAPPGRSGADLLEAARRPVVAVLDTPVREHDWLGDGDGDDAFWRDAGLVEDGWAPDFEVPEESADGQLSHAGHGTFIAGMVRLLAPDANVLSVPVMHGNGVVEEEQVLDALRWLRDRVAEAVDHGRPERFVDVVNLSFGRYLDPGEDAPFTEEMRTVLGELSRYGVRVVASAGNRAVKDDVFPATLGEDKDVPGHTALVSVGARDPDGTLAAYTSIGDWVTVTAPGTSVVSTLPKFAQTEFPQPGDLDATGEPTHPDPNFQASGIGQWSGTSFAAAWVSASIAAKLLEQTTPGSLIDNSPAATGARATSAWKAVQADLKRWVADHGVVD
ncbi:MAG TPA: S8/S53 family peptidase [Nocardioidaceae bacterium]|nr:S8/S53 family peptidase [Nocardioidaceae bacterium]